MKLISFEKISVPKNLQNIFNEYIFNKEKVYMIRYKMKLNKKDFEHGQVFINKNDVLKFCERNKITIEELKKVWKN